MERPFSSFGLTCPFSDKDADVGDITFRKQMNPDFDLERKESDVGLCAQNAATATNISQVSLVV
jgi:hypothetical protein